MLEPILVVDDQRDSREMLAEYLAFCGFAVHQAGDGAEAIDVARRVRPRVILMDLMMPRMDGWEATRRLKADKHTKDSAIIALSAHTFADDQLRARQVGCAEFIAKPCDLERLGSLVRLFLNGGAVMAAGV